MTFTQSFSIVEHHSNQKGQRTLGSNLRMNKNPSRLAREILNSKTYLNSWEIGFLNNVPKNMKTFGHLTTKQYNKLRKIAKKAKISAKFDPEKKRPSIIILWLNDLKNKADTMSNKEKIFLRKQLHEWNKYKEISFLDKTEIFNLHKKYYS